MEYYKQTDAPQPLHKTKFTLKKQLCLAFPSIFIERKQGKVDEYSGSNLISVPNFIYKQTNAY